MKSELDFRNLTRGEGDPMLDTPTNCIKILTVFLRSHNDAGWWKVLKGAKNMQTEQQQISQILFNNTT
jgi:hypothetical protein